MGKVVFNMTVSVDGFVAGPNDSPEMDWVTAAAQSASWIFRPV